MVLWTTLGRLKWFGDIIIHMVGQYVHRPHGWSIGHDNVYHDVCIVVQNKAQDKKLFHIFVFSFFWYALRTQVV